MDNEDEFQVMHLLQLMLAEQQGEDELLACVLGWCAMDFKKPGTSQHLVYLTRCESDLRPSPTSAKRSAA